MFFTYTKFGPTIYCLIGYLIAYLGESYIYCGEGNLFAIYSWFFLCFVHGYFIAALVTLWIFALFPNTHDFYREAVGHENFYKYIGTSFGHNLIKPFLLAVLGYVIIIAGTVGLGLRNNYIREQSALDYINDCKDAGVTPTEEAIREIYLGRRPQPLDNLWKR